ncbi:MAG: hypothetical protein D6808_02405 [Candidatus Dadabacteria bacterium]|nr:MAG: hypothetical protein D6808_02405 [Candidatus Dadabacteria bacterium]
MNLEATYNQCQWQETLARLAVVCGWDWVDSLEEEHISKAYLAYRELAKDLPKPWAEEALLRGGDVPTILSGGFYIRRYRDLVGLKVKLAVLLMYGGKVSDTFTIPLSDDAPSSGQYLTVVSNTAARRHFTCSISQSFHSFTVTEEIKMEKMDQSEAYPVAITLGEVELTVEDFMRLQSGITLTFNRPSVFRGFMSVFGTYIGEAEITVGEKELEVKVKDVESFLESV